MARVLDDLYLFPPKTGQIITVRVFDGQGLDRVFDGQWPGTDTLSVSSLQTNCYNVRRILTSSLSVDLYAMGNQSKRR